VDIARRFNVGYEEIVAANPGVDPWLPNQDGEIVIPTQWVLPATREGVVINLAAMRLFYFPKTAKGEAPRVITHPVGIGRIEWNTPLGKTHVIAKSESPSWFPTDSIKREHAKNGDPLPNKVPPGPDNPMGAYVLRLGWPQYAIHGTNKPASIGLRGTHGCLRMYPEDIAVIYQQVPVGTPVTIINEPLLLAVQDDVLFMQSYPPLQDDKRNNKKRFTSLINKTLKQHNKNSDTPIALNKTLIAEMTAHPRALTLPVTLPPLPGDEPLPTLSVQHFIDLALRVKNRTPLNASWDGDIATSARVAGE
jgi:L,D-transpeptidase ErfK/SrfK